MNMVLKIKNVLYKNRDRYAASACVPEFYELVGEIVPSPKWVDDNHLCFSTGDKYFPMRVIRKSDIMASEHYTPPPPKPAPTTDTWKIQGSKGNVYDVTRVGDKYNCTCVGFGFRHDCKHVKQAKLC